ncbi:MAG: cupin domain-containing protein [Gaiellales bacterium]
MAYSPSPRPTFARPTALRFNEVTRHTWGDPGSGRVEDWIYVSSELIHTLVYGIEPGDGFRHSEEFRTVFGADLLYHVLQGTLVLANPETGEVVRAERGESVFFRKDTWHHGLSYGDEPLRVLEFFAPPPSTGTSGAYARTRPFLPEERWRYGDDNLVGALPGAVASSGSTLHHVRPGDRALRLEGDGLVGLVASTEHLTVATLRLPATRSTPPVARGGDVVVFAERGALHVSAGWEDETHTLALGPWDAAYLPRGTTYTITATGDAPADALVGVAPSYLARA